MITNYFTALEFQVTISRMPNVEFFIQRTSIPSVSSNPATMPTPFNRLNFVPDKLQYSPLELTFIVDESMKNYMEVLSWIKGTSAPEAYSQYKALSESSHGVDSDITILTLNSHKVPTVRINFSGCIPVSLSEIVLDTTAQDVVYPEATVSFAYNYFTVTPYID